MSGIFENFLGESAIYKDRNFLNTSYVPEQLPCREEEISKIAGIVGVALRGEKPSNLLEFGSTGAGKTAVTKYVGREVTRACEENSRNNVTFIYINCASNSTPYGVTREIGVRCGAKIPHTGWDINRVFQTSTEEIDSKPQTVIAVLDEVGKLVYNQSKYDALYQLTDINNYLSNSSVSLIGITNDTQVIDSLEPRVKSRLSEERIVFPSYDAEQIRIILEQRAGLALKEGAMKDDSVIPLCSAITAGVNGDARYGINLFRIAADIAEREGSGGILEHHVSEANGKMGSDLIKGTIEGLPTQTQMVAASICYASRKKQKPTTGDVYDKYSILCKGTGADQLTARRVTDMISELEAYGIIGAPIRSFGRGGRTREISLLVSEEVLLNTLGENSFLEDVPNIIRSAGRKF